MIDRHENTFLAELWSEHNRPGFLFQTIREEGLSSDRVPSSRPTASIVPIYYMEHVEIRELLYSATSSCFQPFYPHELAGDQTEIDTPHAKTDAYLYRTILSINDLLLPSSSSEDSVDINDSSFINYSDISATSAQIYKVSKIDWLV